MKKGYVQQETCLNDRLIDRRMLTFTFAATTISTCITTPQEPPVAS
ncbi:hypothetical protein [Nonlabens sp.]|nr:hypothetical protein [Nonlabens sp.]